MTGTTISKFGKFYRVVGESGSVAVQTPAHIDHLGVLRNIDSGHIAMTGFAVQPCRDMGAVYEMNKVRNLSDRHPGNLFVVQNVVL